MTDPLPPYVPADPVVSVQVLVTVAGAQRKGEVFGWRGARVEVRA